MKIIIKNNNDFNKTVRLFGFNKNLLKEDYDNPKGIEIKLEDGTKYIDLISMSSSRPFCINSILIETHGCGYDKDGKTIITCSSTDANGQCCILPLVIKNNIKYNYRVRIDGNTELILDIKGYTEYCLDIDIDGYVYKHELNKKKELNKRILLIN